MLRAEEALENVGEGGGHREFAAFRDAVIRGRAPGDLFLVVEEREIPFRLADERHLVRGVGGAGLDLGVGVQGVDELMGRDRGVFPVELPCRRIGYVVAERAAVDGLDVMAE
jgi:hypothetical protein